MDLTKKLGMLNRKGPTIYIIKRTNGYLGQLMITLVEIVLLVLLLENYGKRLALE